MKSASSTFCDVDKKKLPLEWPFKPERVKKMKLSRSDFGRQGKKVKRLNSSPKKRYEPAQLIGEKITVFDYAKGFERCMQ